MRIYISNSRVTGIVVHYHELEFLVVWKIEHPQEKVHIYGYATYVIRFIIVTVILNCIYTYLYFLLLFLSPPLSGADRFLPSFWK